MDEKPVFVDASGRRRLWLRWVGISAGTLLGGYLTVVFTGIALGGSVPYAPWPTGGDPLPKSKVLKGSLHPVGDGRVRRAPMNYSRTGTGRGTLTTPRPSGPAASGSVHVSPGTAPSNMPISSTAPTRSPIPAATKTSGKASKAPTHNASPKSSGTGG